MLWAIEWLISIKNVKINYHDFVISKFEAYFARGDRRLNDFIYALYKKGVYRNDLSSQKVAHRIKRAFRGKQLFVYFVLVAIVIGLCYCYKKGYILKKKAIDLIQ